MWDGMQKTVTKVIELPWGQAYQMGEKSIFASVRKDGQRMQRRFPTVQDAARWMVDVIGPASQFTQAAPAAPVEQVPQPAAPAAPIRTRRKDKRVLEAVKEYLDDIDGSVGKSTLNDYRGYLKRISVSYVPDITPEYAKKWLKNWDGKPTSQQHALRALSAFWNWCSESDWVKKADNPCNALDGVRRRLKRQKQKQPKTIVVWTPEETEKIYRKCLEKDPRIKGWFIACTWLGLRPQEALRVSREDLKEDCLTIPPEKAKSSQGRYRTIEFTGPLEEVGKAMNKVTWYDGDLTPWTDVKAPGRIVTAAAAELGIKRGHDVLRHSCATYLSQLIGEDACSKALGHSVEVERAYYNGRKTKADAERYYGIKL